MANEPIMTVGGLPENTHIDETRDGLLQTRVAGALATEPGVESLDLEVEAHKGTVRLNGFVATELQIARAKEIAAAVEGVERVVLNIAVGKKGLG